MIYKIIVSFALLSTSIGCSGQSTSDWKREWPHTDFTNKTIDFSEVISGGPPKDGIPAIDEPQFLVATKINDIGDKEPVIYLKVGNETRAYPFHILMWHEIVNDQIKDVPGFIAYF